MTSLMELVLLGVEDIREGFKLIIEDINILHKDVLSLRGYFSIIGIILWLTKVGSDLFTIMLRVFEPVFGMLVISWNLFLWLIKRIKKKKKDALKVVQ